MSNLQMIEMLCSLVEQQSQVIRCLATELEQQRALSDAERTMVEETKDKYSAILGTDEIPET